MRATPRGHLFRLATGGVVASSAYIASKFSSDEGRLALALDLARVDATLRPTLAAVLPHHAFIATYSATRTPFLNVLGSGSSAVSSRAADYPVTAAGLSFRNDLGNAAGLDKDGSLLDLNYALGAGFAVVGTVLSEAHTGNVFSFLGGLWAGNAWTPLPLSGGALNALGLPSKGVDAALENVAAFRELHGVPPQRATRSRGRGSASPAEGGARFPIGISIMGHPAHGSEPAKKLEGVLTCVRKSLPLADFLEINESCPNVHHGGGSDTELAARLAAVVAERDAYAKSDGGDGRRVPVLVKLGDLGAAPKKTVHFLSSLGIDGVVALNTQKDYEAFELPPADRALLAHYTQAYGGGLSGPPLLDRSTAQVAAAHAAVRELRLEGKFAIVHVGGVQSTADVLRSRETGAELRQWYTGLMHGLAQPQPLSLYARLTGPPPPQTP